MEDFLFPCVIFIGIAVVVGGLIYWNYLQEKKRREALEKVAGELGFEFSPNVDAVLIAELGTFHLFQQGHSRRLYNLMRGEANGLEVLVFDYTYVTGGGKSSQTWNQTVVCFHLGQDILPHFQMRPESVWDRIGQWFGYQDINFDSHPVFSTKYLLRGADEDAVRELFTDHVLGWYELTSGLSTEGRADRLLFYRQAARTEPDMIRKLLEEGFQVLNLFLPPP
jgi:hypothetical protein